MMVLCLGPSRNQKIGFEPAGKHLLGGKKKAQNMFSMTFFFF